MSIALVLNNRSYEYDVYTLVIAFWQGVPVRVYDAGEDFCGDPDLIISVLFDENEIMVTAGRAGDDPQVRRISLSAPDVEGTQGESERTAVKNALKSQLYDLFSALTGRTLPWGDLTGIRPVKLAYEMLVSEQKKDYAAGSSKQPAEDAAHRAAQDLMTVFSVSRKKAELAVGIAGREQKILQSIHPEEGFSLYIGIPFCPSICLYCSFSSGTINAWWKEADRYVETLIREIRACGRKADRPCFPGKKLTTVYVGGGTPTTLTPKQLDRLCCALEENFEMDSLLEFTVEAGRPDTITREKLEVLKKHGVSRISINPQTMNQKTLDLIGRKHTVEETVEAFRLARSMNFDNINMDLIVGLPGEGLEEVECTMRALEELDPDDITVHALALKRAARLALHMDEYESISFQASDAIMERTQETCRRLGMTPYYLYRQKNMAGNFENVGCAKAGKAGLYNILIMEEVQSILALGASGSTKIVYPGGRIERIENVKDVRSYLDRIDEMIARKEPLRG